MNLGSPIQSIKGVGAELAKKLALQNIYTVGNLLEYYPRRYDDYSLITDVVKLKPGPVSIKAVIKQIKGRYVRRGLHITEAIASDPSGSVRLVWFNQPYRAQATKRGARYFISGEFQLSYQRLSIMNPSVELVSDFPINTARIVPIYKESKGLKSIQIRKAVKSALILVRSLEESLPAWIAQQHRFVSRPAAVEIMHFPTSSQDIEAAKRRLGFEEVFQLSLAAQLNKQAQQDEHALKVNFDPDLAKQFVANLPFKLTNAQRKVIWQIYQDMQKPIPMNRLVEGDVGSGKTVVAAMAGLMALKNGLQVALMAPTELLARQHADVIYKLLTPMNMEKRVSLLIGSLNPKAKAAAHKQIKAGKTGFMVGTHALISNKVDMHKLGLVIIDEQHRFGVEQRKKLQAKAGHMPHVLSLSATPIPRSLALTLYGELDVSLLDEMPTGRIPPITTICSPNSRAQVYSQIDKILDSGGQAFVVCPIITEGELNQTASAEKTYQSLRKGVFKHRRLGLLHGKMKPLEKEQIMSAFVKGDIDILVTTTVIEVGVDVPKASVMFIENADRFGLAQIHQLRGRVGRRGQQAYCFLMTSGSLMPSNRLRALTTTNDGFKLAELDLEIRGPGAIYGTMQHGVLDLQVAKLSDTKLIAAAHTAAKQFIEKGEKLLKYPHLAGRIEKLRAITNLN